jgi:putative membrane protein
MKKLLTLLIIAGSITTNFAKAQSTGTTTPDTATLNFITQANIGGIKEIKSGKLATQRAKSVSVKAFGAKMIADHSKANAQLLQIAKSKKYTIAPPSPGAIADDPMLNKSTGAAFDKSYVSMMVADHQKTVALFQKQATTGTDPAVKAFAQKTLPILQKHLTSIKSIAAKMNITPMSGM